MAKKHKLRLFEYQWRWMTSVTKNPNHPEYPNNGGQGIDCYWNLGEYQDFERWILERLGPRPPNLVLGRIDKTRHFEPGNLEWQQPRVRSRTCRQNVTATYGRKRQSLAAWSEELDIPYWTLRRRYSQGHQIKDIVKEFK